MLQSQINKINCNICQYFKQKHPGELQMCIQMQQTVADTLVPHISKQYKQR